MSNSSTKPTIKPVKPASKPISSVLADPIKEATEQLGIFAAQLAYMTRLLRRTHTNTTNSLPWDTAQHVARSLRYCLNLRRQWLYIRNQFSTTAARIDELLGRYRSHTTDPRRDLFSRQTHYDEKVIFATEIKAWIPRVDEHEAVRQLVMQYNELCETANTLYINSHDILTTLPEYMTIKKLLPINGRAAYSCLLAAAKGKVSRTKPDGNLIFGWAVRYDNKKVVHNLRKVARAIVSRRLEKHGPAPSFTTGCAILSAEEWANTELTRQESFQWKPETLEARRSAVTRRNSSHIYSRTLCGTLDYSKVPPSFTKYLCLADEATLKQIKISHAVAYKVMGLEPEQRAIGDDNNNYGHTPRCENSTLTTLLGSIERVQGDDYYAPCMYIEDYSPPNHQHPRRWEMPVLQRVVLGFVLLRKGWPDMIHCTTAEFNNIQAEGRLSRKLDEASASHFRKLRDAAEASLTQNQRIARMLLRLRSLFIPFSRQDSYAVSNCQPGTEAFIQQLKQHSTTPAVLADLQASVGGPELARCWRKAKYPQVDRFNNVINRLLTLQEQRIQDALLATREFFPVETIVETLTNQDADQPVTEDSKHGQGQEAREADIQEAVQSADASDTPQDQGSAIDPGHVIAYSGSSVEQHSADLSAAGTT